MKRRAFVLTALSGAALAALGFGVQAQDQKSPDEPVLLVANVKLIDAVYARTVLLAVPAGNDRHIGLIINRPTSRSLSSLFPEHEPSKQAVEPVYFGGPMSAGTLFALVRGADNPGKGSITIMNGLHLAIHVDVIDHIIETVPNDARYYVGMVQWRPGELRDELRAGMWDLHAPKSQTIFRKDTSGLWRELSGSGRGRLLTARLEATPPTR